jgi:uncharacterized protein (DUF58 family)
MSVQAALLDRLIPRARIRQRFLARVRARRGPVTLPFQLEYRNIFVLPTIFGTSFGLMLVFMALGGLNFNNSMALLLVFIFGVIAQLTAVLAYRNLVGLRIESIRAEPVFCGDPARFLVYLGNPEDRVRQTTRIGFREIQDCADVQHNATAQMVLEQTTHRRGWIPMESFRLETRYPLGLFKAWAWFFPEQRCLVYPAPAKKPPPLPRYGSGSGGLAKKGEGEQMHGIRQYRSGDSLRRVAWRTSARHDQLYTREMETPRDDSCEINWDKLPGMSTESRLSVLTAWVLMADHRQVAYSLVLPGVHQAPGLGADHRRRCLEALALYGQ